MKLKKQKKMKQLSYQLWSQLFDTLSGLKTGDSCYQRPVPEPKAETPKHLRPLILKPFSPLGPPMHSLSEQARGEYTASSTKTLVGAKRLFFTLTSSRTSFEACSRCGLFMFTLKMLTYIYMV